MTQSGQYPQPAHPGQTRDSTPRTIGLDALFHPDRVVVIGANRKAGRIGNSLVKNLVQSSYWGKVTAVNPSGGSAYGVDYLDRIGDEGGHPPDLALVAVAAPAVPAAIRECGRAGVRAAVVIAADMGEDGPAGESLAEETKAAADETGLRILGPNTLGFFTQRPDGGRLQGSYVGIRGEGREPQSLAIIGQGGGLTSYVGSESIEPLGVGPRYLIDTGNELDIDVADCLAWLRAETDVTTVGLVLESARRGRKLAESARACEQAGMRVVVLRLGRTASGQGAARLHTGALATGSNGLWHELEAAGAYVTGDERDFVANVANLHLTRGPRPANPKVAVVTWSGGFGVHAADLFAERGVPLASFERPVTEVEAAAMRTRHPVNPLDLGGYSPRAGGGTALERLRLTLDYVLGHPTVDICVLWEATVLQRGGETDEHIGLLSGMVAKYGKPLYFCGSVTEETATRLRAAGIAPYRFPSELAAAVAGSARFVPEVSQPVRPGSRAAAARAGALPVPTYTGPEASELLDGIGIRASRWAEVSDASDLTRAGEMLGFPLVLKYYHPVALHKSDYGFIKVVHAPGDLADAYAGLTKAAHDAGLPGGRMVAEEYVSGFELAIGASVDPELGPMVMVGQGGTGLEATKDVAFALAPVTHDRVVQMLDRLVCRPLLDGKRSAEPNDVEAAVAAVIALSEFIAANPGTYSAVDLNPVMVLPEGRGAVAVDAVFELAGDDHREPAAAPDERGEVRG